jgi:transcription antitermination protein NusB
MGLPPQKFREIVLQLLYSQDFTENSQSLVPFLMEVVKVARTHVQEASFKVEAIVQRLGEIDEQIRAISTEYSFDRISKVERTILRLGAYEFLYEPDIPTKVILAEAIRLCRKFGTRESADFVNAVLHKYVETTNRPQTV